ncbi:MAG: peptidoglycan-associated lipoprotein Pal [Rhodobacteraceae bacterium]|nr:peptidoglycan-associated lipoprotein Pal [Paracoccaceae bacterium]
MKFKQTMVLATCLMVPAACVDLRGGPGDDGSNTGSGSVNDPTSVAYFNQTIVDRVFFEVDQSTLNPTAIGTLDAQSNWLLQNTAYAVTIEGHADEQGTREYNIALGARRANAVRDYLVSKGIAASRIDIVTYGKERPIAICSEEICYARNRRAVTLVTAGLGFQGIKGKGQM